jgi:hypothetical protein
MGSPNLRKLYIRIYICNLGFNRLESLHLMASDFPKLETL